MAGMVTTSLRLDSKMKERVRQVATAQGRTLQWVMQEAIRQYVEREERRETLRQEGRASWGAPQGNGIAFNGEEMDTWLAKLEEGEEPESSESHV